MLQDLRNTDVSNSATNNVGAFDPSNDDIRYIRSEDTQSAYEQRIDELFSGSKADLNGVHILDKSDVLDMLGYGGFPVRLNEAKVLLNQTNHPEMTAEQWKKIPQWLDNPATVLLSRTHNKRMVFVPNELINGAPVYVIVEPNHKGLEIHALINSYAKDGSPQQAMRDIEKDLRDGNTVYVDKEKARELLGRSGLQLPRVPSLNTSRKKILTEKNLAGYRKNAPLDENQKNNDRANYDRAKAEGKTELTFAQWKQVRTPEFKAWFGDWENDPQNASKIINQRTGEPLVVYHGTNADFTVFEKSSKVGKYGSGFYFTADSNYADEYNGSNYTETGITMPVFLNIRNPLETSIAEDKYGMYEEFKAPAHNQNYDGVIVSDGLKELKAQGYNIQNMKENAFFEIVAKQPNQIKSAIGNNGQFDGRNPDIRFSLNESATSDFANAIDKVANNEQINKKYINLGTTPDVFKMIGLPDTRVDIDVRVIRKLMEQRLSDEYGHNLSPDEIKKLPEQLNNPIAILRSSPNSTNPNAFVALTEMFETDILDKQQKPVIVSLFIKEVNNNLEVIKISSVHGRNIGNIRNFLSENEIFYWNKEKGLQFLNLLGLRLPTRLNSDANLRRENIKTESDLSQYKQQNSKQNSRISEQLQSRNRATPEKINEYQTAINQALGKHAHAVKVVSRDELVRPENAEDLDGVEGFYNSADGSITLIAESLKDAQHAQFVAWHELGHRKADLTGYAEWQQQFKQAENHQTVRQLADKIQEQRKGTDDPAVNNRTLALEEAVMELYASHETGNYKALEQKYGIKIPRALQRNLGGFLARLGDKLATIWRKITGNNDLSSNDVYQMLQDLRNTDVSNSATDNVGAFDKNNNDIRHARSEDTKSAYEQRIDDLFSGKTFRDQIRVLDRSDLLDMLGYGNQPVVLVNSKVNVAKHPNMTATEWKKVPEWLDNPSMVFDSDTVSGRLVFIAPETVQGEPVMLIVEPANNQLQVHVLLNAYDKHKDDGDIQNNPLATFAYWRDTGKMLYINKENTRQLASRLGLLLPQRLLQPTGIRKILTEKNLQGYRKNNPFDTNQTENNSNSLKFSRRSTKQDIADIARTGQVPYNKGFIFSNQIIMHPRTKISPTNTPPQSTP